MEDTDGDGMTFLMHAASGATNHHSHADRRATSNQPRAPSRPQHRRMRSTEYHMDSSYSSQASRQVHPLSRLPSVFGEMSRLPSVFEESNLGAGAGRSPTEGQEGDGGGATADLPAASDDLLGSAPGRLAPNPPALSHSVSQAPQDGDEVDDPTVSILRRQKGMMYPSLVVFKTAWSVVEEVLWKEQVSRCCSTVR